MKKILTLIMLCSAAFLSAGCYNGSCGSGNYYDGGYYNNGYYNRYNQTYYNGMYDYNYNQPYYQYQGYYRGYYNQPYYRGYNQPYYNWQNNRGYYDVSDLGRSPQQLINQPATAERSDQDINTELKGIIGSGSFSKGFENVSFDVNNGILTLSGNVNTQADKARIEDRARNLQGIKEVVNNITVTNP